MRAPPTGVGRFASWDGGCLLIGRSHAVVPLHAHYALQIAFRAEGDMRFRSGDEMAWVSYEVALVPSRQRHAMDAAGGSPCAVLLVEPETRAGRALEARVLAGRLAGAGGIADLTRAAVGDLAPALFAAWREEQNGEALAWTGRAVVDALAGGRPQVRQRPWGAPSDARILRAVAYVNAHLDAPLTLVAVAAAACLSPSRFRHLFVAETGMSLRAYVLWRRFVRAWELISAGEPLSSAAHRAGFADAAHLTRTSRRMFGLPPSALQPDGPPERAAGAAGRADRPPRTAP
jgi:AraC family transcriptional regulator